jgi:hypothetical protein
MSPRRLKFRIVPPIAFALMIVSAPLSVRAQISVVGNNVEEKTAAAGDTYIGTIVVKNLTAETQPVRIYQTDYSFFADGTSHFDPPGSQGRSNARWITPATGSVIIPPSGEITVAYTVRVPAINSLHGTYWSTLMVEGAVNPPHQTGVQQMAIGTVMRYAIQVATHLNDEAAATVILEKERALTSPQDSTRSVELEVRNNSDRGYRPLMWVEVYDATGALRGRVQQQRGLLYPGTSIRQTFVLGKLPPGAYKAVVFADTGDEAVFAAQYKLAF